MTISAVFSVAGVIAPIFLVLLTGAALRASGFLTEAFAGALNRFVFWVPLPCMIVHSISNSHVGDGWIGLTMVLVVATLLTAVIAWAGALPLGISRASRGTFAQSVFRCNDAYVGIPVIAMAFKGSALESTVLSYASLGLAPCLILYNLMAVIVLTPPSASPQPLGKRLARVVLGVARNPLIIACVVGTILLLLPFRLPRFVDNTLGLMGSMASAGALFALGATLTPSRLRTSLRGAHAVALLKLVACPLVGVAVCALFGLAPELRIVVLVFLACPSAVASFVMAEAMHGDAMLAGSAVALTTIYSIFSLGAVLLFAMP